MFDPAPCAPDLLYVISFDMYFLDSASLLRRMSVKRQVNYPGDVKEAVRFFKGVHIRTAAPKRIL